VGQDYKVYSDNERSHFAADPEFHLQTRKAIEKGMNSKFATFFANSPEQQAARNAMLGLMKSKLHDQKLEEVLIPNWSVGCRRITPGLDYLESLAEPNVEVVYGEIGRVTEKGCVVDEVEHEVDVLICATGFDTTFKPRFPLIGANGKALSDVWKRKLVFIPSSMGI
jgi:cyclohexanone monooxygenase